MKLAGRLAAAIDVLAQIETRRRPVSEVLKDWGNANRFAGSRCCQHAIDLSLALALVAERAVGCRPK